MASRKLEDRLDELKQLRKAATVDSNVVAAVRKGLEDRSNLIVAEAAKLVGDLRILSLVPDLLHAFDRFFEQPGKADPKCWAKTAIAKALTALDYSDSPPFIRGSQHVQMEPVWGGQEDTAAQLRAMCLLALVQCTDLRRIEVLRKLVDAMTDPAERVRIEVVGAIEQMSGDEASLVLRLKAHLGDERPIVIGQVFDALLNLERERAVEFVEGFLKKGEAGIRDEAALALGASRLASAVECLMRAWKEPHDHDFGVIILRALSSSRQAVALGFLLDLAKDGSSHEKAAALDALQLHRDSPEIQKRIEEAKG
jgi:HEAT repeat protein